ncbi:LuxR C-terminal-related transcriptional regulator [Nocardioides montaniterrae]
MTTTPIRVFLVDAHEVVRRGVASLLEPMHDVEVVGEAATCAAALPAILRLRPDVVVSEAHLGDGSGIEMCRAAMVRFPDIHTMILTTDDDREAIATAILQGIAGYLLKGIHGAALVSAVRLVAEGSATVDPSVAAKVLEHLESHHRSLSTVPQLTPQQGRIFRLIGEGLTNREIAAELQLAEKTVKNHITAILAKLGLQHRTQAAVLGVRLEGLATAG